MRHISVKRSLRAKCYAGRQKLIQETAALERNYNTLGESTVQIVIDAKLHA